jgi:hypothetical protein
MMLIGRVVAIEQAGGGDKAHLVSGTVVGEGLEFGGQIGHNERRGEPEK